MISKKEREDQSLMGIRMKKILNILKEQQATLPWCTRYVDANIARYMTITDMYTHFETYPLTNYSYVADNVTK